MSKSVLAVVVAALLLSACGGGGGGGGGGGTSPPGGGGTSAPPPPSNVISLTTSQSFTADDARAAAVVALASGTPLTTGGGSTSSPLTISYNAGNQTYTVSGGGLTDSFGGGNITRNDSTDLIYHLGSGNLLTLNKQSYTGSFSTQYVRLGYWEHDSLVGTNENLGLDVFTYGFPSPASAVPRTGAAAFDVAAFGLSTQPGREPLTFQGNGLFNVDFLNSVFFTQFPIYQYSLVSGDPNGGYGGGVELNASGKLSSTDSSFNGYYHFGGVDTDAAGPINGRFYGPNGEEIGATFSGNSASGGSVTGALTGAKDSAGPLTSLTLTNLVANLTSPYSMTAYTDHDPVLPPGDYQTGTDAVTPLVLTPSGALTIPGLTSDFGVTLMPQGAVRPNFTRYTNASSDKTETIDLYQPGAINGQLALTYTSFADINIKSAADNSYVSRRFTVFGNGTSFKIVNALSGSAHYAGVTYGAGHNESSGANYDVTGTSSFDINFANQTANSHMDLTGTGASGTVNFGGYDFAGMIRSGSATTAFGGQLIQDNTINGSLTGQFFGPAADEVGAVYTINVLPGHPGAGTTLIGAAVAKRQ